MYLIIKIGFQYKRPGRKGRGSSGTEAGVVVGGYGVKIGVREAAFRAAFGLGKGSSRRRFRRVLGLGNAGVGG